ncbi:MAG: tetratricopeptide repeat protein, partial [Myxococcales bacterium]|nr:tetratricopeptide repeat protein [Myxococcales bacterium]
ADMSESELPGGRRTNLGAPLTSFVGRDSDLTAIDALFRGDNRLVTLVGPPGAGKTRLALEYARSRIDELAQPGCGGVWFCDIGEARSERGVCRAVARALDVGLTSEAVASESVARMAAAIAARGPMLLVLDNFEHVARSAGEVILPWLQQAAEVELIVTSRVRLGIQGEAMFDVGPLLTASNASEEGDLASDAVQLLVQRARAVRHDFTPTAADAPLLVELVRRLDGLPLAIELAGARLGVLGPKQLLERLSAAPTGVSRALGETLDWSWNLLEPEEQSALAQLSVFHGGFMLEAAEAIVELPRRSRSVLDVLGALRDNSLLRVSQTPELAGEVRFTLLDTIRTYAAEKLAQTGGVERALERHTAYYLARGEVWSGLVEQRVGPDALNRLAVELPNLVEVHRAALAAPEGPRVEQALSAVLVLEHLFYMRGPTSLFLALLDAAFERGVDAVPAKIVGLARKARARALRDLGRLEESALELQRALSDARAIGDKSLEGRIRGHVGFLEQLQGKPTEALATLELALACVREARDQRSEGMLLASVAQVQGDLGHHEQAAQSYDEALRIDRAIGNRYAAGFVLASRAELNRARGMHESATVDLEQGLAVYREFKERRHEAIGLCELGAIQQERGKMAEARESYERSIACHRDYGSWLVGVALGQLGDLEREERHYDVARSHYGEALMIAHQAGEPSLQARWLLSLAGLSAAARRHEAALALLAEGEVAAGRAPSAAMSLLVLLHRGMVEHAGGNTADATECLRQAEQSTRPIRSQPVAVRFAYRMLQRALSVSTTVPPPPLTPWETSLSIAASGRWFRLTGNETVSLQRRHALRLVLRALLEQRLAAPDRALSQASLLEAGWPGEKVGVQAGGLRVYNALSTLRKLGLRQVLLSRDD